VLVMLMFLIVIINPSFFLVFLQFVVTIGLHFLASRKLGYMKSISSHFSSVSVLD
jgi:hypothetical protein